MIRFNLFHATFLVSILIPWVALVTTAIPIPVNDQTKYASNAHSHHAARVQAAHDRVSPGQVNLHYVDHSDNHMTGSVLVDRRHVNGMSTAELHVHAEHAAERLRQEHPGHNYHVQAHHTPGDAHAMIHAVPSHHVTTKSATPVPGHNAVRMPGGTASNAPHKGLSQDQQMAIFSGLTSQFHPPDGSATHPLFTAQHQPANHGAHGTIRIGTVPVARPSLQVGMNAATLDMHQEWIHHHLVPQDKKDKVHIHVQHTPGEDHVKFHIVPARTGAHVTPHEIDTFLHDRKPHNQDFRNDPMTNTRNPNPPVGQNQYTFRGAMPAHTLRRMTLAQTNTYAAHAQEAMIQRHSLVGDDADGMSMSTAHKAGQTEVRYHTQPKTEKLMKRLAEVGYGPVNAALMNTGQTMTTVSGKVIPWRHSDQAVLEDSARVAGIPHNDAQGFLSHIDGHVLGNAGQGDRPCNGCHDAFKQIPARVTYTDQDRY